MSIASILASLCSGRCVRGSTRTGSVRRSSDHRGFPRQRITAAKVRTVGGLRRECQLPSQRILQADSRPQGEGWSKSRVRVEGSARRPPPAARGRRCAGTCGAACWGAAGVAACWALRACGVGLRRARRRRPARVPPAIRRARPAPRVSTGRPPAAGRSGMRTSMYAAPAASGRRAPAAAAAHLAARARAGRRRSARGRPSSGTTTPLRRRRDSIFLTRRRKRRRERRRRSPPRRAPCRARAARPRGHRAGKLGCAAAARPPAVRQERAVAGRGTWPTACHDEGGAADAGSRGSQAVGEVGLDHDRRDDREGRHGARERGRGRRAAWSCRARRRRAPRGRAPASLPLRPGDLTFSTATRPESRSQKHVDRREEGGDRREQRISRRSRDAGRHARRPRRSARHGGARAAERALTPTRAPRRRHRPSSCTSGSSSTPKRSRTRRRPSAISAITSAVVASPRVLHEVRVLLREARAAHRQPAAAGLVEQHAGAAPLGARVVGVLEGRAEGLDARRLCGLAPRAHVGERGLDRGGLGRLERERGARRPPRRGPRLERR